MSEQAKKLAQALRSIIPGPCIASINDAAAELERLAELCDVLTAERDTARSATASMLRRRDTVANELRCQCQALAAERDAMRAQVTTLAAERDDWAALVGKLREEVGRQDTILNTQGARISNLTVQCDALAEGVRAYRLRLAVYEDGATRHAAESVRAWERQHGHRADKKQEPARKADEVEEKPPLLDLRTLPVGTVCEAETAIRCTGGPPIAKGDRFTIKTQEPADYDGAMPVQVAYGDRTPWLFDKQSARVIASPKPAPVPEPFRAGLPALALRRVCTQWDVHTKFSGHVYEFIFVGDVYNCAHWTDKQQREPVTGCGSWAGQLFRPHAATWAEVELKAARMLGKENPGMCSCGPSCPTCAWLCAQLGITEPRDTALWVAFREGQRAS